MFQFLRLFLVLAACMLLFNLQAQDELLVSVDTQENVFEFEPFQLLNYDWQINPSFSKMSVEESKQAAFFQKYHHALEYFYDEKGDLRLLELIHHTIRINQETALNQYNKVFIPLQNGDRLLALKARSIAADGTTFELDVEQMRQTNEHAYFSSMMRFPIEGATVNSEVEYFYVIERSSVSNMGYHIFPSNILLKNVNFDIITPSSVVFKAKTYNGLPETTLETDAIARNVVKLSLPQLLCKNDKGAHETSQAMRLHYRFSHYLHQPNVEQSSWENIANSLAQSVYAYSDTDKKQIQTILNTLSIQTLSEEDKIKNIESYLKDNIRIEQNLNYTQATIQAALENHVTTHFGMLRLFAAFLQTAKIDHRLVSTADKSYFEFDETFPSWDFLHTYLFHFPALKTYLMPTELNYRYNYIPFSLANTKALFIKPTVMGGTIKAISYILDINYKPILSNTHTNYVVRFTPDMSKTAIDVERELTGYAAIDYHAYYYLSDEPEKAVAERFDIRTNNKVAPERVDITRIKNTYYDTKAIGLDSFQVQGRILSSTLVEQADQTYLFKIGSLLDAHPKSYYQQANVEKGYPQEVKTIIEIEIPEGYIVRNPDALKKQVWIAERNQMVMHFKAEPIFSTQKIRVEVTEFYRDGIKTKEQQAALKRIHEASINYSNTVLILQKMN